MDYRIEHDQLGEKQIPIEAYYGIHTLRAKENFGSGRTAVNKSLIKEIALIKKGAALVNKSLGELEADKAEAIVTACEEIIKGQFDDAFIIGALQGGAGTSTNMNVNEVIANRAIELMGGVKGDYDLIHPLNDVNKSQSTNDVYPTGLRIAAIGLLRKVSQSLADLQEELQTKENDFSDILKLGRTQLMDALPMMVGQGFGAYAKAIARDRWRIYKVEERLRQTNLGGTAIGTGMNASKKFIYMMTDMMQNLTGLGLARSEFPMDITQNMDVFVEVSGLLKSCAVNLQKISNDLRLLASGPYGGFGELNLPAQQGGSSIMPGKVNPVMPEFIGQVAMKVMANDQAITMACGAGQLELNAFTPLIAESLLESLEILQEGLELFRTKCIKGLTVNKARCKANFESTTSLVTALVHHIGYEKASDIAVKAMETGQTIRQVLKDEQLLTEEEIEKILNPYEITKPGIPGLKG